MYDMIHNHRLGCFLSVQSIGNGSDNYPTIAVNDGIDQWAYSMLPNSMLIAVDVQDVTGGTLNLIVQDSDDLDTWDTDFITVEQITAIGFYSIEVYDFKRYIRLNATVATHAVIWGAYYITFENQRRPVTQTGLTTDLTLTYGTGRNPKVSAT